MRDRLKAIDQECLIKKKNKKNITATEEEEVRTYRTYVNAIENSSIFTTQLHVNVSVIYLLRISLTIFSQMTANLALSVSVFKAVG